MAKMGAPTKLTQEVRQRAEYYCSDFASDGYSVIPTTAGMALYLGVSKAVIANWAAEDADFLVSYNQMLQIQESLTVNKSLKSEFNSNISKLILSNHGYSDRQAIDVSSTDGTMSPAKLDASKLSQNALQEILDASPKPHER